MTRFLKSLCRRFSAGYPIRRENGHAPFFIIGSGRSGNTLLRRMLMGNRSVYIPPETYVLGQTVEDFRRHAHLDWDTLCKMVLFNFAASEDFRAFPTIQLRELYLALLPAEQGERSLAFILDAFYRYMALHAGREDVVWGDKTPLNVYHLADIDAVFPGARYIHIYRDGCDVVASYLKMGRYSTLEQAAQRWLDSVRLCREFGGRRPERYFELRYEELVAAPKTRLAETCEFLGIAYTDEMLNGPSAQEMGDVGLHPHHRKVTGRIVPDSVGRGRKGLSDGDALLLRRLIGDQLEAMGYRPP
jgi:protein-tyrosine sulfotransferase